MKFPKVKVSIFKSARDVKKAEAGTAIEPVINNADGFISHPTDLHGFKQLVNHSSILPQCINAYKNNICGFGIGVRYKDDVKEETPEMKAEWEKITEILELLNIDKDTKEVFEDIIEARETYGIAYLEVIRNFGGEVMGIEFINNVPSIQKTPPLLPYIEVECALGDKTVKRPKKFCKYRQQLNGETVFFKEIGDPRIMDNRTGEYAESVPKEFQANEILEFAIGTAPYGEVRWIGTVLNVDGSKKAENLNNRYFSEGRHTPLMIVSSNGSFTQSSYDRMQEYMNDIKGENGQHAFMLLELENKENRTDMEAAEKPDFQVIKMADILQKDELFQDYLDNNRRKVQSSFQLPDLYVGYTTDFNRATAQAAQEVTEEQVFQPARQSLAWLINNKLLSCYHFKYVEAYFLDPDISNPDDLFKILSICEKAGGLTPNKAKEIAYEARGEVAENYEGDWADMPLAYLQMQNAQGLDQTQSQQVTKAVEPNSAELTAVLKEIRTVLLKSEGIDRKPFTFNSKGDIINKDWSEDAHPRDEKGKFTSAGGSSSSTDESSGGESAGSVSAEGENTPCTGFASKKHLSAHYNKHGDEVGASSKAEYQQKAIDFLKQPCGGDIVGYSYYDERAGFEKVVRFNTKTTEYATGRPGKQQCTYFKPKYDKKHGKEKVDAANNYYESHKEADVNGKK